jgi:hypothetical protein
MEHQASKTEQLYIPNDAVELIWKTISKDLKNKTSLKDLNVIVRLLINFYDETGLIEHNDKPSENDPLSISDSIDEEIVQYLVKESARNKINLTEEDILEILDGEYEYLRKIGAIDEDQI